MNSNRLSPSSRSLSLKAIHAHVGGECSGDGDILIQGVNALELAQPGELAFAESPKYLPQVRQSHASAIIVSPDFPEIEGRPLLRINNPRSAFIKAVYLFCPPKVHHPSIHPSAVVAPDAQLAHDVTLRECVVIRSGVRVDQGTVVEAGAFIGEDVRVGSGCFIGPNVVIMHGSQIGNRVIMHGGTVIGADGFGYVWDDDHHLKIPQLGNVVIEDDVELGANVCVDRATFGSTVVGRGTKIDNLVQIAHNDTIGQHVIMAGQVGLAGSVKIGNRVMMGGKVGVVDHILIGDDAKIGGGAIVTKSVPKDTFFWGFPARPIRRVKEELAALALLPGLLKRLGHRTRRESPLASTARKKRA